MARRLRELAALVGFAAAGSATAAGTFSAPAFSSSAASSASPSSSSSSHGCFFLPLPRVPLRAAGLAAFEALGGGS